MSVKPIDCFHHCGRGFGAVVLAFLVAGIGSVAKAQQTSRLPAPVRGVSHDEALNEAVNQLRDTDGLNPIQSHRQGNHNQADPAFFGLESHRWAPANTPNLHSHQVIRSPNSTPAPKGLKKHAERARGVHPPHSHYKRRFQPQPAVLPQANQQATWKTPYSYGYFGASGKRQWSMHHGYRDRYTEWRLK